MLSAQADIARSVLNAQAGVARSCCSGRRSRFLISGFDLIAQARGVDLIVAQDVTRCCSGRRRPSLSLTFIAVPYSF